MKKKLITFLFVLSITFQLKAHVNLLNPIGGETFNPGDIISIEWIEVQSHELLNWDILFSNNGGITWDTVKSNLPTGTENYSWALPETQTMEGRIKVVQDNDDTDYESISGNFVISSITGIETPVKLNTINMYPNPVIDFLIVEFENPRQESFSLIIYDIRGQTVQTIPEINTHKIYIERKNLTTGIYFFKLNTRSEIYAMGNFLIQ